jgi:predicted regulator of Ras-like GTPase activity (Roadblock/LC7/MglB family)
VNDPNYEEQREVYCELLKAATGLMSNMQKTLNTVLTQYRLFIEELWEAICAGKDPSPIATRFQQQTEEYIKRSWDPVFTEADKMMQEIEKSKNSHRDD